VKVVVSRRGGDVTTISELAEKHGLVLEVHERDISFSLGKRWYALFKNCETKEGGFLRGEFGNGSTPREAAENYCRAISGKRIVIRAGHNDRQEIDVPNMLLCDWSGE
jgi:hypothetical protein